MIGEQPIQSGRNEEHHTLIDQLLAEQRTLTAVAQFAKWHDVPRMPMPAQRYRNLIPVTLPKPGEQLAFEVELDKCSGCKACVTACHNLNQLDENETWRSVGFLHGGNAFKPLQANVTTACHHCVDPACLNGCPVLAYEKDSITGIVRHLGDRCMGCQYCILKCPYEVPQFRKDRGIVRKCDMCSSRLANNEAPACVQSCPNEAIRIVIVDKKVVAATTTTETELVPGAPKSEYTIPTTRYRAEIEFPANTEPADFTEVKPQPAHWPLSAMLVLTQLSVGLASSTFLLSADSNKTRWITLGFAFAGLAASGLHLGKPFRAWRALVNLRRSWLSREIAAFSLFAALVSANVFFSATTLSAAVVVSGLIAVFTSVMIYVDTRRVLWSPKETGIKFFGSTALLGLAATLMLTSFKAPLVVALILVSATKLAFEAKVFLRLRDDDWSLQKKSALLLCRNLKAVALARFLCGAIGGIFLPLLILEMQAPTFLAVAALGLCFAGELLERHLFFRAAVTPKMPGGVAA